MKKVYIIALLILIMCSITVYAENNVNTYENVTAYRYDEQEGYIEFDAFSLLNENQGSYGKNADYDIQFWKVTNKDGIMSLQDKNGKTIINIGTNDFEIICAKYGIFACGSNISGYEDVVNSNTNYSKFEGIFDIYNTEGMMIISNVASFDRLNNSEIALIKTGTGECILYDCKSMCVLRNLNYDDVQTINYNNEYVQVKNYGRYSWEDKTGLFNSKGEFIIPAKYQQVRIGEYGITVEDKDWNYLYYDFDGKLIGDHNKRVQIVDEFYYVSTDDVAHKKELYNKNDGLICKLPDNVESVCSVYSDGYIIAYDENNRYGIINDNGEWTTKPEYTNIVRPYEEYVYFNLVNVSPKYLPKKYYEDYIATKDSTYGIIDADNYILKEFGDKSIYASDGAFVIDYNYFCFDESGKVINLNRIDYEGRYHNYSDYEGIFTIAENGKYVLCRDGYIKSKMYDYLENLGSNINASNGNTCGIIDSNDDIIVPFEEWTINCWELDGKPYYFIEKQYNEDDSLYGVYDMDGKVLLSCEYLAIEFKQLKLLDPATGTYRWYYLDDFNYHMYVIQGADEKYGFIDENFNIICNPIYDYIEPFYDGTAVVGKKIETPWVQNQDSATLCGMINLNGEEVLPCKYKAIINGLSYEIVFDYEKATPEHYVWTDAIFAKAWTTADKGGNILGTWKEIKIPDKYNSPILDAESLPCKPFNKNGYAVLSYHRDMDIDAGDYIHNFYDFSVIIDQYGNYITNPFWHGYGGSIYGTKYDEGTFQECDTDSFNVRSEDIVFNEFDTWKEWNYGEKFRYDGYSSYGFVNPGTQSLQVLYDEFDRSYDEKEYYWSWVPVKVNGKIYYYVTVEQYGKFVKVLDDNGNIVIDGNPTNLNNRYIAINDVYLDNPLIIGENITDFDKVLETNYYNKSKSLSFLVRDFAKPNYNDNHIFNVSLGDITGTTNNTGRIKLTPENKEYSEAKISANGYLPLIIPSRFLNSYGNNFYMYKTDYSIEPVAHAVFFNTSNVYKPNNSNDVTYYSGDINKECVISPIINTNGNNISSVKIVQGKNEKEIFNKSLTNIEIKDKKTYGLWLGESTTFKPGMDLPEIDAPIYLVITTKTGTETKIKLQLKAIEKMEEEIDVNLGDEVSFSSDENYDSILGGMNFKYKMFDKLPSSFKLTPVGDGNYTFKATLGVESKDKEDIYETMDDYYVASKRDAFDKEEYGGENAVQRFNNFFKKLSDENIVSKDNLPQAELGKTCGIKLFGYLEGSYDLQDDNSYKLAVEEGGMSAKFSFDFDVNRQIIINGVPCYWKAGLGFEDAITVPLYTEENGLSIPDSVDNEFDITVTGGGGVGIVDAVSLGASGEATLAVSCTIPLSKKTTQAILSGKINLFEYQLGILNGSIITLDTPELQLYPEIKVLDEEKKSSTMQLSRDYTNEDLTFNVENVQLMSAEEDNYNVTHSTVADNTYTFSMPQIISVDANRLLAVWVEDDRERQSDADRTAIYYSVYENGWSKPQVVFDDTTADFNPILKKVNNNVYLLWSNANKNFGTDESDSSKIAMSLSTAVAKWNGTSFDIYKQINNSGVILNDITCINGKDVIVWTGRPDGDLRQTSAITSLYSAEYVDDEWNISAIIEKQKSINGLTAAAVEDKLVVYYSQDSDGDVETINDNEIYSYFDSKVFQITDNAIADTKPIISNGCVYWYSDSKIAYKQLDNSEIKYIDVACLNDKFNVSDDGTHITYSKDNDQCRQSIFIINRSNGLWGEPIEIVSTDKFIINHALTSDDNNIILLSNEVFYSGDEIGKASLDLYKVKSFGDLKLDNLIYNEYSMNGEQLHLICDLTNNGFEQITGVNAEFIDESGNIICKKTEQVYILPGQTTSYIFAIPAQKATNITAKVTPVNFEDTLLENNTAEVSIYCNDISAENIELVEIDNNFMISSFIFNRGLNQLKDVEVTLRKGSIDGEIIDSVLIANIDSNDFEQLDFIVDNTFANQLLYVVCKEVENENLLGNNSEFIKVPDKNEMVLMGDVYGDGVVNSKDAVKLAQYLADWDITLSPLEACAADVVSDDRINSKDAVKLAQYLADWDVTLEQ